MWICLRCIRQLNQQQGLSRQAFRTWHVSSREHPIHSQTRQIVWLSLLFASREQREQPPTPRSTPVQNATALDPEASSQLKSPPIGLAEGVLKTALENQQANKTARQDKPREPPEPIVSEAVQKTLEEWNETDPIEQAYPEGFQEPLGHLTDEEQIAYFANPPPEYLETLDRRTAEREEYEKLLYLSNPVQNWPLCYSVEPNYMIDGIRPWIPWSFEKRTEVMEKFRRYDERFAVRYRGIYRHYDSSIARQVSRKRVMERLRKQVMSNSQWTRKEKKRELGKLPPPKEVLEVMMRRDSIQSRNIKLLEAQKASFEELAEFSDITEKGDLLNAETNRMKWKKQAEKEVRIRKDEFRQWSEMSHESKAESMDWGAIHSES